MLLRVPDYYESFRCLAGDCPHSCCEKWEVVLDEDTVCRYRQAPGPLGEKLRRALQQDAEGDFCFPLNGGRCPFLDGDNLCEIHRQLGEAATSVTCREHPRFTEDYGAFREITLSASCPAAGELLLGSHAPLRFVELEDDTPGEPCEPWLEELVALRDKLLAELEDRSRPFKERLGRFLALAAEGQAWLDEEECPTRDTWAPMLPENALAFLGGLEVLEADWPSLLAAAEAAPAAEVPQTLLERIAVYFAFRYLLKCVNDGDLWSRAQFVVFSVLAVERLAAVCGLGWGTPSQPAEALRRFSCEVEHSDENVLALLEAFDRGDLCVLPSVND